MSLKECFETRKLRHTSPDMLKAQTSVETAMRKSKEARKLAEAGFLDNALITAYAAMFHAARALLFKDGIIEKSHYCLIEYIKENYVKTRKLGTEVITAMDAFREERHDLLYGFEPSKTSVEDVEMALDVAANLISAVNKLLGAPERM